MHKAKSPPKGSVRSFAEAGTLFRERRTICANCSKREEDRWKGVAEYRVVNMILSWRLWMVNRESDEIAFMVRAVY
jgi:hypothetical protein